MWMDLTMKFYLFYIDNIFLNYTPISRSLYAPYVCCWIVRIISTNSHFFVPFLFFFVWRWFHPVTPLDNVLVHLLLLISFPLCLAFSSSSSHHQPSKIIIVADVTRFSFKSFASINWLAYIRFFVFFFYIFSVLFLADLGSFILS